MGNTAKKRRFSILQNLRNNKFQQNTFVITPSINGKNIFDIYPSYNLLMPYYQKQDFLIVGVAYGYYEALEVTRDIIDEMYTRTGGLNLSEFLKTKL